MNVNVSPISAVEERGSRGENFERKSVHSKITSVVLPKMSGAKGGLLSSAIIPQILIQHHFGVKRKRSYDAKTKRKGRRRKVPLSREVPIGLMPVDPEGCLNALMQFILAIPEFAESFALAPKSFSPFYEFIDQYVQDREEGLAISAASGDPLFRFLAFRVVELSVHEIFHFFLKVLTLKWKVYCTLIEAMASLDGSDFFLMQSTTKRQIFTQDAHYELNAFIELRPDGPNVNFLTFVKHEGNWYQCDDQRITQIRSNCLGGALLRSVLLHYKKIAIVQNHWG